MEVTRFDDDLLNLKPFASRLQRFIEVEHHFVEGSLVIALSSRYGSGKTTFLNMWANDLRNQDGVLLVQLNAWESDYCGDPLFAIVSGLVHQIPEGDERSHSIIEAAKDLGWFATSIGNQLARRAVGVDAIEAGQYAEKRKADREPLPRSAFEVFEHRRAALGVLKETITEYVASSSRRIVFLVDELDRCRPDFAIAYLETIKHIFDIPDATFILAADRDQLANSARAAFGPDLDFEEYYRKFVHREVSLPKISEASYEALTSAYVDHFLQRTTLRECFMEIDHHRRGNIADLLQALQLTPRQVQEVFRILGHLLETDSDRAGTLRWPLAVGSIAMAALRVGNPQIYGALGSSNLSPTDAANYLKALLPGKNPDWWFALFLTGGGLKTEKEPREVLNDVGFTEFGDVGRWIREWGTAASKRFQQVHDKIEHILQWGSD